jgi:hypothetical protein
MWLPEIWHSGQNKETTKLEESDRQDFTYCGDNATKAPRL